MRARIEGSARHHLQNRPRLVHLALMTTQSKIIYASEPELDVAEFRLVLVESTLGETRPVDDEARLQAMLSGANLVLTARLDIEGH